MNRRPVGDTAPTAGGSGGRRFSSVDHVDNGPIPGLLSSYDVRRSQTAFVRSRAHPGPQGIARGWERRPRGVRRFLRHRAIVVVAAGEYMHDSAWRQLMAWAYPALSSRHMIPPIIYITSVRCQAPRGARHKSGHKAIFLFLCHWSVRM
jgi:hypothetical protein